jgi:hypothetical protein
MWPHKHPSSGSTALHFRLLGLGFRYTATTTPPFLCLHITGKLQVLMEERQALELRADNLGSELTKSKSAVAEMETMIQAHHAAEDELKAAAAAAQEAAASATECASAREAELKALQASNTTEVAAWQAKAEELKAVRVCVYAGHGLHNACAITSACKRAASC